MSVYAVIPPVLISTVWLHKERMVASKGSVSTCMRQVRFTWIISSHLLSTRQCRCYCYPHYAEKVVWGSESWSNFPMATLLGSPAVAQPPPPASLELTLSSISYPSKHPVQVHCSENLKRFIRLAFKAFPLILQESTKMLLYILNLKQPWFFLTSSSPFFWSGINLINRAP